MTGVTGKPFLMQDAKWRQTVAALITLWICLLAQFAGPSGVWAQEPQCIPLSFADIAEHITPAVVNISTSYTLYPRLEQGPSPSGDQIYEWFFDETVPRPGLERRNLGSGLIIDPAGYIITNNHVIEDADEIRVRLSTEEEFEAEIIGRDVKTDIALIKIMADARTFPVAELGNSDTLRVGEWVIAVGNPYGLSQTVTAGIVSAKGRVIGGPYDDFIQTDASINPGNSGGPLLNIAGQVIGINSAIFANLQGNHFAQGIGFAIPINIVSQVVHDLQAYGKVQRGWLGIVIQDVTPDLAESFNLPDTHGALIANVVPGGPADQAGLKRGDVVLRMNETEIVNSIDLPRMTADSPPGTASKLTVNRDGEEVSLEVVLGEFPESDAPIAQPPSSSESSLGMDVQDLTPELAREYGLPATETGVIVLDVQPGSPADTAQIRPGDILSEMNRIEITSLEEYHNALEVSQHDRTILVLIKRGASMLYTIIKPKQDK